MRTGSDGGARNKVGTAAAESFRILDAAASGSFLQTIIVMAAWVGWIFGGLWMNRSALREINGLPPREAGKGDDDHA